jgi:hydroxypyruvate isomerase
LPGSSPKSACGRRQALVGGRILSATGCLGEFQRFHAIMNIKFKNTVSALNQLISMIPDDITLVLEPLNTLVDHPAYYLNDIDTASAIVRAVGSPRLKILCDLYHFGVMGVDLKKIVTNHLPEIGHFHIADAPGPT